jgi:spermidine/putrescine-binding protein
MKQQSTTVRILSSKKVFFLSIILLSVLVLVSCGQQTLLLLNWGEYINEDLLVEFEETYGVTVKMSITDSNELFYSRVKSGTTAYDLVIPSDYMVEKMVQKDLVQKIQFDLLTNYEANIFTPGVKSILDSLSDQSTKNGVVSPADYCIPYFWGTFGIMYDKNKNGLEAIINNPDTAVQNFFSPNSLPNNSRVGIYDSPRFIYSAALQALGISDINQIPDGENKLLLKVEELLKNAKIFEWGFDTIKKNILSSNLELGYTWTGDMLDMLYLELDEGKSRDEINFDLVIPSAPIAFMDAFVIPKDSRHVELAHQFIDFFLDPVHAYENASTVGYCTPVLQAYNWIVDPLQAERDGVCDYAQDSEWLDNWAWANQKYYPLNSSTNPFYGISLSNFDQTLLDKINQMINKVKTS